MAQGDQPGGPMRAGIIYNPKDSSENLVPCETLAKSQSTIKLSSRKRDRGHNQLMHRNEKCTEILKTKFKMYEK